MRECTDFLLSICCVDENNHTFNEIEVGYESSLCWDRLCWL